MSVHTKSLVAILLTIGVLSAVPAHAQIVSVLDEGGQRVYINPTPHPVLVPAVKQPLTGPDTSKSSPLPSSLKPTSPASSDKHISQNGQTFASLPASEHNGGQTLTPSRLEDLVQSTAARHNVDPALVRAVMQTESGGNPSAVSRKGAVGLMQLMPQTALDWGVKNIFSPVDNLEAGVRYLRTLLERYNGDLDKSLAAYNAGAGAVDRAGGVPRIAETRDYVRKVKSNYLGGDAGKTDVVGKSVPVVKNAAAVAPAASKPMLTPMTVTAIPPPHKIFQTTDAQGHIVWANE